MLFNQRIWKKLIYPISQYYKFQPPLFDIRVINQTDLEKKLK